MLMQTNPQQLRKSALKWQLMAIDAQTRVLTIIAEEHRFNLQNFHPEALRTRMHDVVSTAEQLASDAGRKPLDDTLRSITAFGENVRQLKTDADTMFNQADFRAHFRLDSTIGSLIEKAANKSTESKQDDHTEATAADPTQLLTSASQSCYKAEHEQYHTFVLQVNAICDLAMEMLFVAAAYGSSACA